MFPDFIEPHIETRLEPVYARMLIDEVATSVHLPSGMIARINSASIPLEELCAPLSSLLPNTLDSLNERKILSIRELYDVLDKTISFSETADLSILPKKLGQIKFTEEDIQDLAVICQEYVSFRVSGIIGLMSMLLSEQVDKNEIGSADKTDLQKQYLTEQFLVGLEYEFSSILQEMLNNEGRARGIMPQDDGLIEYLPLTIGECINSHIMSLAVPGIKGRWYAQRAQLERLGAIKMLADEKALDGEFKAAFNEAFIEQYGQPLEQSGMLISLIGKGTNIDVDAKIFVDVVEQTFIESLERVDREDFKQAYKKLVNDVSVAVKAPAPPYLTGGRSR